VEAPVVATPVVVEVPAVLEAPVEVPVVATPIVETPVVVEAPVVEASVVEVPVVATPIVDASVVEVSDVTPVVKPTLHTNTTIVEKLESSPLLTTPSPSAEKTLQITPKEGVELEKKTETVLIDTEPSVHFTPYDTVFDETTPNISEIRYTPKVSVEDKDEAPKLTIGTTSSSLDVNDIVNVENDVDTPLTSTDDFEVLA